MIAIDNINIRFQSVLDMYLSPFKRCLRIGCRPLGRDAFSVIELLVALAVIAVLMAIIVPSLLRVRDQAITNQSASNLRQLGVAVMLYASEKGVYPPGNTTFNDGPYPLWETLRPYAGGGERHRSIPSWECPRRAITRNPNGPIWITPSYSANSFVMVDSRDRDGEPGVPRADLVPVAKVARPSEVIGLIDASQRSPSGWSNAILTGTIFNTVGNPANANRPLSGHPITEPDTDVGGGTVRYRHKGTANAVFLDGSVRNFAKGDILEKHLFINY